MASHSLPEVLRRERDLAFHVQDSSEVREKAQDILNKLSEDHYIILAIHQPILHRVTVVATRFLSSPPLAPGRSSSDHNQRDTALVPGVALASNDGTAVPCPGLYLLDDAHATAYSYGPSMATGFIVLHSSLLRNLDLEETTFTSTTNPHLVAFIIAHELGHLLLCHLGQYWSTSFTASFIHSSLCLAPLWKRECVLWDVLASVRERNWCICVSVGRWKLKPILLHSGQY